MLHFKRVTAGYYHATSPVTGEEYVIRTRPKGDGWMAIADSDNIVLATGMLMGDAIKRCAEDARAQATKEN